MATIEACNIGPVVERVRIPVPEGGGVVVLTGRNGRGKSKLLAAVDKAVRGVGSAELSDHAESGFVLGLGAMLSVGKSQRRTGELEIDALDSKCDIGGIIEPGIKDPMAADAKRIRSLLQLLPGRCDESAFHDLLGGSEIFEEYVGEKIVKSATDIVDMAIAVKKRLEAQARSHEEKEQQATADSKAILKTLLDKDDSAVDEVAAKQNLESAIRAHESVVRTQAERRIAAEQADRAKRTLQALIDSVGQTPLQQLQTKHHNLTVATSSLESRVQRLRAYLADAEKDLIAAKKDEENCAEAICKAADTERAIEKAREAAACEVPQQVSDEEVARASREVEIKRDELAAAIEGRKAREQRARAQELIDAAYAEHTAAAWFRSKASGVESVLSEQVAKLGCPLRVEGGRLVLNTDRGVELMADLSAGERARIVIDAIVESFGKGGLFVLSQECWEGLDPVNRAEIVSHCKTRGVVILTAEATDDAGIKSTVL